MWLFAGLLAIVLLTFAGLWWWASSAGSLPRALALAQKYLPEGQSLQFADAEGSITGGGRIGQLQWAMPGTEVRIDGLQLDWALAELFGRALHVRTLQAKRVHLRLTSKAEEPEPPAQPFAMPADLALPIRVSLPLAIGRLDIETVAADGSSSQQSIEQIAARYQYDGTQHALQLDSLHYGQSQLQADLQVGARNLDVHGRVGAYLHELVPETPFTMLAGLHADGSLAGGDAATLNLQLAARQQAPGTAAPVAGGLLAALPVPTVTASATNANANANATEGDDSTNVTGDTEVAGTAEAVAAAAAETPSGAARIDGQATLHPWRQQPVQQARLALAQLNAHDFHAQAPITTLGGSVAIEPADGGAGAAAAWDLLVDLANARPGAWDQQHAPLRALTASARWDDAEGLTIHHAQAALEGTAPAGHIDLSGQLHPQRLDQARLTLALDRLDLQPLLTSLPQTEFGGQASVAPLEDGPASASADVAEGRWLIEVDIRNARPGLVDQQLLPLRELLAKARITPERWSAETLQARIGDGTLQLQGHYDPASQALDVQGQLLQLPLVQVHSQLAAERAPDLSGTLNAQGDLQQGIGFDVDIHSDGQAAGGNGRSGRQRSPWDIRAIQAKGHWAPELLRVERIHLDAFQAQVDSSHLQVALPDLASIEATLTARAPGLSLDADAAMQQQSGGGKLALNLASAEQVAAWLKSLPVVGASLPALSANGGAQLQADWQGGWQQWLDGLQNPAAHPALRLDLRAQSQDLRIELPAAEAGQQPTRIDVAKLDARVQGNLAAASLVVDGDIRANDTRALLDTRLQMTQASGRNGAAPSWRVAVEQLAASATLPGATGQGGGTWQLQVAEGLQLTIQTGSGTDIRSTAGQATLKPPASVAADGQALELAWEPLHWQQSASGAASLQSTGQIRGIRPAWIDALAPAQPPLKNAGMRTDLLLSGNWDIQMAESLGVRLHLQRDSGDLWLGEPALGAVDSQTDAATTVQASASTRGQAIAAGIRTLSLDVQSEANALVLTLDWDTERAGVIKARAQTQLVRQGGGWQLSEPAPLSGSVQARLQDLSVWGTLAPPGWRVAGALDADIALGGSVQAPELRGSINGSGLNIRSVLDGVELHDGQLRATLDGNRLDIAELTLQGGTGSNAYVRGLSGNRTPAPTERGRMTASGFIDWSGTAGTGIAMDVRASLEKMQVLVRSDRQMSLSGDLSAGLQQGALRVRGSIMVDRASITLPESGAPTLGTDVVVVRASDQAKAAAEAKAEAETAAEGPEARGQLQSAKPMDLELKLDLGRDFALQGYGITTRLEGNLTVRNATSGNDPVTVVGEIRTDEGRYRAWGQALNVETGIVLFNGPYANPSLNLLAIRPNIDVRAGVRVTGTANAPRVQLYSEPELPEAEKLSWVVLGRAAASGGAEGGSMQQAALGLLAGSVGDSLATGFGFDEVGLSESGVSVSKRLSDQLYVTYEAGMAGAASTLYVFYDITRRLTARGQTGETSAVDLIYTITYD
ncbi:hypothetical protein D8I35_13395 [Corticibacter populi]|uniref:Translocation and assembly module TamB C-terminal domain-containing protein n=1 Tax=Corticibacter populi TaxID=1550736 RepID=A0A3M6QR26_9BURK|nr:hypothetical protein D8I35_13395 [Corticibacter populi]